MCVGGCQGRFPRGCDGAATEKIGAVSEGGCISVPETLPQVTAEPGVVTGFRNVLGSHLGVTSFSA